MLAEGNDGTCRAAMEAMACGTPVIASRTGALAELVDDRCGWLVEPGDKAGLAKAMIEALSNRVATRRKGESARRKILASYNESIRTGAFAGFYDRIYRMNGVR
jgi:glycosyltransferase involved in cell wall biosynthesis